MVATDGYRLSVRGDYIDEEETEEKKYIIPARIIRELSLLKDGQDAGVFISKKNNQVLIDQEDLVISGRLIEAEFPDYQKIIPTDFHPG